MGNITRVVFMIAHDVDYMFKLSTHMIKELTIFFGQVLHISRAAINKVFSYTDIASKNQDISTLSIFQGDGTKF
jgi:hypothetical protein